MEKRNRAEAVNGEILLPEAIIQHIQSFLSGKEAAQTCILSKSWYSGWLTRPNLDFNQPDFRSRIFQLWGDGFSEFTKKTMQRYEELNLKIESLRLCMKWWEEDSISLANELLVKAIKMGVIDLNFRLLNGTPIFTLPNEVLGSETLIKLSVNGCKIDLGVDGKVSCSRLKSLSLFSVYIEGDIIWDIISSCPLIEELCLSECTCYVKVKTSNFVSRRNRMLALRPPIEFGKRNLGSGVDCPTNLYEFRKLKCLLLEKVKIDTSFFSDFSSKFPCLRDLTVHHCFGYKEIQISSQSLECISFTHKRMLRAKFDCPSICKFSFSGSRLPSLSFETTSREWESDISIMWNRPCTSWFLKLNKFLTSLSMSKISLSLNVALLLNESFDCTRDVKVLPKPVVENLIMLVPSAVCSDLLDGLFWSFRPKFVSESRLPIPYVAENVDSKFPELLCMTLIEEVSEHCYIPNRNTFGLHDIREVNVEYFEESLAEWRPLPWKTLLDASTRSEIKQKIRFRLRWGEEPVLSG